MLLCCIEFHENLERLCITDTQLNVYKRSTRIND